MDAPRSGHVRTIGRRHAGLPAVGGGRLDGARGRVRGRIRGMAWPDPRQDRVEDPTCGTQRWACLVTPCRHHSGASGGLRYRRAGSLLPNRHGLRLLQCSVHEEQSRHPRSDVGLGSDRSPALTVRLRMAWHGRVCRSASGLHVRPGAERWLRYLATIV